MKAAFLWLGLLLPVCLPAATTAKTEDVTFKGVLVADGKTTISLSNAAGNSRWVEIGRDFAGYRVTSYEPATETLSLVKDGVTTEIRLQDAKVRSMAPLESNQGTQAERLAFWEKIKNLEGEALIAALRSDENPFKQTPSVLKLTPEAHDQPRGRITIATLRARVASAQKNAIRDSLTSPHNAPSP